MVQDCSLFYVFSCDIISFFLYSRSDLPGRTDEKANEVRKSQKDVEHDMPEVWRHAVSSPAVRRVESREEPRTVSDPFELCSARLRSSRSAGRGRQDGVQEQVHSGQEAKPFVRNRRRVTYLSPSFLKMGGRGSGPYPPSYRDTSFS